jgi:dihydroorotate dehydrogenase (NAD+) catalytic subunit
VKLSAYPRLSDLLGLKNPLVLASGPLGRNAKSMLKFRQVAGAIVGKSVTWLPQKGNPEPRISRVKEWGLINWEDLPNPGYEAFAAEVAAARAGCACPIIGSIGPIADIEQQQRIAVTLQEAGADAIELDFKWGAKHKDRLLSAITKAVKEVVSVPVIAKLSPFVGDIVENAQVVQEAGADAITAINTIYPAMRIDVRLQRPTLSSGFGGLSGQPILPIAVAMIYQIYEAVEIPILGSGGVVSGEDALEMIMAGAEAVQICTVAMLEGPTAFTRINQELEGLIQELQLGSMHECIGIAHRYKLHVPRSATAYGKAVQKKSK